jgi:hypothetical protein
MHSAWIAAGQELLRTLKEKVQHSRMPKYHIVSSGSTKPNVERLHAMALASVRKA